MADYYRDRVRHGGILSNNFISFWWNKQVLSYQYGLEGRSNPRSGLVGVPSNQWGEETIEGNLSPQELKANRQDQTIDTAKYKFRNDEYFASKEYRLEDIEVPVLSVANWVALFVILTGGRNSIASPREYSGILESRVETQVPPRNCWSSRFTVLLRGRSRAPAFIP